MIKTTHDLTAAEAAERLGISQKALRLYEQRGLVNPTRSKAGWRVYGPDELARAGETAALRALGLSLAEVEQVLKGDPQALGPALAAHQKRLEAEIRHLTVTASTVRQLRAGLAAGETPKIRDLVRLMRPDTEVAAAFALPWPWGGERFELRDLKPLTWIIGPLGSGKTRLARALADHLPDTAFIGLDRDNDGNAVARMNADPELKMRVDETLEWLGDDGATPSPALIALVVALETAPQRIKVIDMIEQGLDQQTQEAVTAHLRRRRPGAAPILAMTRSSAILDLAAVGPDEAILFCPANHSMPMRVAPQPGAPGYEAVETCLAPPDVRARTEGVIAFRPKAT